MQRDFDGFVFIIETEYKIVRNVKVAQRQVRDDDDDVTEIVITRDKAIMHA